MLVSRLVSPLVAARFLFQPIFIGRCTLAVFFIFILTPLGLILRLMGQDSLQLKHPRGAKTYWHQARDIGPLDRLF